MVNGSGYGEDPSSCAILSSEGGGGWSSRQQLGALGRFSTCRDISRAEAVRRGMESKAEINVTDRGVADGEESTSSETCNTFDIEAAIAI